MAILRILEGVRENVVEVEFSNSTVPIGTVVELDILAELKCIFSMLLSTAARNT